MDEKQTLQESLTMEKFELMSEDDEAIGVAIRVARRLLKHPQITPQQIRSVGNALYALERLPLVTPGAFTSFGVVYRTGGEGYDEMHYIDFRISDSTFEISKGGSTYERDIGSDSFSEPGWIIHLSGEREAGCEVFPLEEDIEEYLELGGNISIEDESDIDYRLLDE
jgi:hypothetical protein